MRRPHPVLVLSGTLILALGPGATILAALRLLGLDVAATIDIWFWTAAIIGAAFLVGLLAVLVHDTLQPRTAAADPTEPR